MVLEISQETFDNAVRENVEILGLTQEEAVDEAVIEFEAQGINLSNIIKESMSKQEFDEIKLAVQKLEQLQKTKGAVDNVIETLEVLRTECERGIQHKVAAGKADAYFILLNTYETFKDRNVRIPAVKAVTALMTKQPDLLDDRGVELIANNLKETAQDPELQRLILRWAKECCVMHEINRQKIFNANITDLLKNNLHDHVALELIRATLALCRALVLDDDVRVEFGKAHEHARIIASETLCSIMTLMNKFKREEQLNHDIVLTLTSLMVRTEFCKKVDDAGGLDLLKSVVESFPNSDSLIRQCYKLFKALAGNDECKAHMVGKGYAAVIKDSLTVSMSSAPTVTAGLSAIAALTLRSPENSKVFFESGIPEIIVESMRNHPDSKPIQKTASWAIRNMVSRSKYQKSKFLELGVEELLLEDLKKFKEIEYDVKAALRDLDCKVTLKEEWTGKGGALTTGLTRRDRFD